MTALQRVAGPDSESAATGDVVFVHGLGGDAFTTWGLEDSPSWSTWLSSDRPDLNIWTLSYDADPSAWTGASMPLADRATNVLAMLNAHSIGDRPICFVGHSMGGLLVKQLLRHASTIAKEYRSIATATRGVVFFSTPHAGSDVANLASYLGFVLRPTIAVRELAANESRLRELNIWFRNNASDLDTQVRVFYETRLTRGLVVVNATSADPGLTGVTPIPIDADHFEVCRPTSPDDVRYLQTLQFIGSRLPTGSRGATSDASAKVSTLRQQLLLATSHRDLRRVSHEIESVVALHPHHSEALVLRDDVHDALRRYDVEPRLIELRTNIGAILFLPALAYVLYKLLAWLFGW